MIRKIFLLIVIVVLVLIGYHVYKSHNSKPTIPNQTGTSRLPSGSGVIQGAANAAQQAANAAAKTQAQLQNQSGY